MYSQFLEVLIKSSVIWYVYLFIIAAGYASKHLVQ